MKEQLLAVEPDGTIVAIYDDDLDTLASQGETSITRVSHVEPNPNGRGWIADMSPVGGPQLGPCTLREEALALERSWLEAHLFGERSPGLLAKVFEQWQRA